MIKLTTSWLQREEVQQMLWRNAFKLVCKNFYVDVDTEKGVHRDKGNQDIKFTIEQRRPDLFKVSTSNSFRTFWFIHTKEFCLTWLGEPKSAK